MQRSESSAVLVRVLNYIFDFRLKELNGYEHSLSRSLVVVDKADNVKSRRIPKATTKRTGF